MIQEHAICDFCQEKELVTERNGLNDVGIPPGWLYFDCISSLGEPITEVSALSDALAGMGDLGKKAARGFEASFPKIPMTAHIHICTDCQMEHPFITRVRELLKAQYSIGIPNLGQP